MDYHMIIDIVVMVISIYVFFIALKMKRTGKISSLYLVQEDMKKMKNKEAFINFMYRKSVVFSIVTFLVSIIGVVLSVMKLPMICIYVEKFVVLIAIFWITQMLRKAVEKFVK